MAGSIGLEIAVRERELEEALRIDRTRGRRQQEVHFLCGAVPAAAATVMDDVQERDDVADQLVQRQVRHAHLGAAHPIAHSEDCAMAPDVPPATPHQRLRYLKTSMLIGVRLSVSSCPRPVRETDSASYSRHSSASR